MNLNAEAVPFKPPAQTTGTHADPMTNGSNATSVDLTNGLTTKYGDKASSSSQSRGRAAAGVTGLAGGIAMANNSNRTPNRESIGGTLSINAPAFIMPTKFGTQQSSRASGKSGASSQSGEQGPAFSNAPEYSLAMGNGNNNMGQLYSVANIHSQPVIGTTSTSAALQATATASGDANSPTTTAAQDSPLGAAPNLATRLPADSPLNQFILRSVEYIPYKSRTMYGVGDALQDTYGYEVGAKGMAAIRAAEAQPEAHMAPNNKQLMIINDQVLPPHVPQQTTTTTTASAAPADGEATAAPSATATTPTIRKFTRFRCVNLWPGRTTTQWCQDVKKLLCRYGAPKEIMVKYAQRSSHTQEFIFDVSIDSNALVRHTATQTVQQLAEALITRVQAGRDVMGFSGIFHLKTRGQTADVRMFAQLVQYFGFSEAQATQKDNIAFWAKHLTPAVYISSRASSHQGTPSIPLNLRGPSAHNSPSPTTKDDSSKSNNNNGNSPSPSVTADPTSGDIFDSANVKAKMLEIELEEKERELLMLKNREVTEPYLNSPRKEEVGDEGHISGPATTMDATATASSHAADINTINSMMALYGINRGAAHASASSVTEGGPPTASSSSVAAGLQIALSSGATKPTPTQIEQTHKDLPVFLTNLLSGKIENPMDHHDNNVHEQCAPWCDYYPFTCAVGRCAKAAPTSSSSNSTNNEKPPTSVAHNSYYSQIIFLKVQNLPFEREDHFGALIHEVVASCFLVMGCFNGLTSDEVIKLTHVEQKDMKPQNLQPTPERPKSRTITEFMFVVSFLERAQWPEDLLAKLQPDSHFMMPLAIPPKTSVTAGSSSNAANSSSNVTNTNSGIPQTSFMVTSDPNKTSLGSGDVADSPSASSQNGADLSKGSEYRSRGQSATIGTPLHYLNELEQYGKVQGRLHQSPENMWMIKYAIRAIVAIQRMPILLDRNGFWMTKLDNAEAQRTLVNNDAQASLLVGSRFGDSIENPWDGNNVNEFNVNSCRTMSYCQQIGFMIQKHRHFLLDGLPCMPLRVKACDFGSKPHQYPITATTDVEGLHQVPVATTPYPQHNTNELSPNFIPNQMTVIKFTTANQRALDINQEQITKRQQLIQSCIAPPPPGTPLPYEYGGTQDGLCMTTYNASCYFAPDLLPTDAAVCFTRESIVDAWTEAIKYHLPVPRGSQNNNNNNNNGNSNGSKVSQLYVQQRQQNQHIQQQNHANSVQNQLGQFSQSTESQKQQAATAQRSSLPPPSYSDQASNGGQLSPQPRQPFSQSSLQALVLQQQMNPFSSANSEAVAAAANKAKALSDTLKELMGILMASGGRNPATGGNEVTDAVLSVLHTELSGSRVNVDQLARSFVPSTGGGRLSNGNMARGTPIPGTPIETKSNNSSHFRVSADAAPPPHQGNPNPGYHLCGFAEMAMQQQQQQQYLQMLQLHQQMIALHPTLPVQPPQPQHAYSVGPLGGLARQQQQQQVNANNSTVVGPPNANLTGNSIWGAPPSPSNSVSVSATRVDSSAAGTSTIVGGDDDEINPIAIEVGARLVTNLLDF